MSSLNITVSNAINLPNVEKFGSSDPYISFEYQGQKKKTKVIEDNLNPQWDENLSFDLGGSSISPSDSLVIKVMDHEKIGPDKLMGTIDVPLNELASGKTELKLNVNLIDKNKKPTTGYVNLVIKYQGPQKVSLESPVSTAVTSGGLNAEGNETEGGNEDIDEVDNSGTNPGGTSTTKRNIKIVGKRAGHKSYSTKPQDFQVRVKVIEARQLQGGNISPVCKIKCKNQMKQTKVKSSTSNPFWDALFFFNFHISASELLEEIIIFEIFNSRKLRSNSLLGSFKFDLSMVYEEPKHAFLNKWLLLSDPTDTNSGAKGYLKICIAILGPGDEASNFSTPIKDSYDIESNIIRPAGIELRPATYILKVFQAEDLPIMDSAALQGIKKLFTSSSSKELVDPYFVFSFAGKEVKTSTKFTCNHPEWNEELKMGLQFPSMCDRIKLQLFDWDRLGNNDAIGTLFIDISSIGSMKDQNGYLPTFGPCYMNFYGGPREFSNLPDKFEALNLGKGEGVAYRGRVLVELTTQFNENSDALEPLVHISEEQILRVSKFLRRRKYCLHTVFMEANMIRDTDSPIEFEVSMGNYGNKFDNSIAASCSSTQPTNAVFDGSYYHFLPWGDSKPCCLVECHWEDISCRLFSINYFLRIADRLTKNIEKIKVAIAANIPEEEQAQFVINAFDDLLMSCNKPLPNWEPGQSPETDLDSCLRVLRNQELDQIKSDAMFVRENATSVTMALHELEGFASQLMNLSIEPQNSMPDIIIWLISGGTRKYYARIPAHDVIWSNDEDYRGRFCGVLQNILLKTPILLNEKDIKDLIIPCQLRIKIWIGQEKEQSSWHTMQKEGKLSIMAETYENQASILGNWTTKSPMMTRSAWSDATGKIKLPKEIIIPPPGWNWDGDWFISPEISLSYDKDALLTDYLEDLFMCEMKIPGGNWGPATTEYTDVKGDPCSGMNEIVLSEGWKWVDEWKIDINRPCDEEGWEYAVETSFGGFQPVEKMYHMCRRRRFVRQRKLMSAKSKIVKDKKAVSEDEHWEYATMFESKFHSKEHKLDNVRRRRWHRKMIATKAGAPCFFNLVPDKEEKKDKDNKQKTSMSAPRMYLKFEKSHRWELRAYIYQARDLLAADQNGFSDPYVRVVFCNQSQVTEIQIKSVCPTWDQTLIFNEVKIHDDPIIIQESPPKIVIELLDYDTLGEDEFLGRCEASPLVKLKPNDSRRAVLQWFPIMKGSKAGGELLAAFEIYHIGEEKLPVTPPRKGSIFLTPDGIRPMMQRTGLEILTWGVRNMKKYQLVNVVSPNVELEIGGNLVQSSVIKNTNKNPNFMNPLKFIDIMLPKEELYMPPINIIVRDHRPFGRKPIVGTCCIKSTDKYRRPPLNIDYDPLDDYPELFGSISMKKAVIQHAALDVETLFKGNKHTLLQTVDEDIDWWTKYYASHGLTEKCQKYLHLGYDTIIIYDKELEHCENYKSFNDFSTTYFLTRGSNDDYDEDDENENVGEFKGKFIIYPLPEDRNEPMPYKYLENKLPSSEIIDCIVRVYIIKAYDLQPEDPSGMADPYIQIRIGKEVQSSKDEYIPNSLTPEFGKMFELHAKLPIFKDLKISVLDYDLLSKDDVIGETVIDLENRFLSKYRAVCGLPQSYCTSGMNQWRDIKTPIAILTDFCTKNRLPTPEFDDENSIRIGHKVFHINELEIKSREQNIHLGPPNERLALHVLRKLPFVKEHIETRPLYNPLQPGIEQGKIEMWVDIHPTNLGLPGPPFNIRPRLAKKFELRIIVKNTFDVILDETNLLGEKMSDIYVKGWINGVEEKQETDVHYRSLDGEGNFNWRFVFPFDYIPTENCMVVKKKDHFWSLDKTEERLPCRLVLQIWDNDKFSADDFLGTIEMNLCSMPSPVKKKGNCNLEQLPQFGGTEVINLFESKRSMGIWPVYNNEKEKPELTGKLELEIELLAEQEISLKPAGCARDDPNMNPHLDPPNRPATSFFWLTSPWKTFKFIIWKSMRYYLITGLVIILLVLLAVLFVYAIPGLLARKMVNI